MKKRTYSLITAIGLGAIAAFFVLTAQSRSGGIDPEMLYSDGELRNTELQDKNPYAIFGGDAIVISTIHETNLDHSLEIENTDKTSIIGSFKLDVKTGIVRLFDRQGKLISKQLLFPQQHARWLSVDPKAEKYYSISPYAYVKNNPLIYIDPNGEEGWKVVRDWNEDDLKNYAEFVTDRIQQYIDKGVKLDCADLSISLMVDYASENGLALAFQTKEGKVFDAQSETYNSVDDFKYGAVGQNGKRDQGTSVFTNINSRDVPSNTFTVDKTQTMAGDMVVFDKPYGHVVVYEKGGATYGERRLTQGNQPAAVPQRFNGDWSSNPRSIINGQIVPMRTVPATNNVAHRWNAFKK